MTFSRWLGFIFRGSVVLIFLSDSLFASDAQTNYRDQIDRIISNGSGHNPQWLRLGHYKPRGFIRRIFHSEFRSEADGAEFFVSPDGKNNPIEELRATLLAFALPLESVSNESNHAQCRFPARRKWAFQNLGWEQILRQNGAPVLSCNERRAWKKQLDADGISLIFASAYLNNAASMFGHTFLKFHSKANSNGKDLLDYGVNFAAETGNQNSVSYAISGLFGFYPGRFTMQPFHQTLKTYANLEGRDLIEYRLRFTPDELDFFIDHLFELERTYFDYYFLTENCSYFLLTALETVKPEINLSDAFFYHVIPADSVRITARTSGLVESTKFRPSLMRQFRSQADRLSESDPNLTIPLVSWLTASTAALDLAIDYGAILATSSPDFEVANHALRTERAKRGEPSRPIAVETPKRPEQGHDPGRIGLTFERELNSATNGRIGFEFRFAYHDRLSNDDGYLKGTTLEVLRTNLTHELKLREIAVLDILSTQPRDRFFRPISWRTSFGIRRPAFIDSNCGYLGAGLGVTYSLSNFLWVTALADGELLANPDIENRVAIQIGPRMIATGFLNRELKIGLEYNMKRSLSPAKHYDILTADLAWAPTKNFELRFGLADTMVEGNRRSEWNVKLFQHLLF